MFELKKRHVFILVDNVFYFTLLGIGFYFIYKGDVIQRYQLGRTDIYTYKEPMVEMPSFVTYITKKPFLRIGVDFNVSFSVSNSQETILYTGKNLVIGTELIIDFQPILTGNLFLNKITPLNFTPGLVWKDVHNSLDLEVVYSFKNVSQWSDPKVAIKLSSENNTLICNGKYFDGNVKDLSVNIGDTLLVSAQPEKFLYLQSANGGCRKRPYVDELIEHVEEIMSEKEHELCQSEEIFRDCPALKRSPKVKGLPICIKGNSRKYFKDVVVSTKQSIPTHPCTKLEYHTEAIRLPNSNSLRKPNSTVFRVTLESPYETSVSQEYLIYDTISVISAIGGTLGLFIGFSFREITKDVISFFMRLQGEVTKCSKKNSTKDDWQFQKMVHFRQEISPRTSKKEEDITEDDRMKTIISVLQDRLVVTMNKQMAKCDKKFIEMEERLKESISK